MRIEIFSDVVCPWCYIGERRLARALAEWPDRDGVDVVFRPYQLDPDAPDTPVPLERYLDARYGVMAAAMRRHAGAAAAAEGITVDWSAALAVNTRSAHRLLGLAAREHDGRVQRELAERLFALHFEQGGDVSDPEQLARAASAAGMDPDRVRAYLASDAGERELDAALAEARHAAVRAVPTFVFDGRLAVEGAQPPEVFRSVLDQLAGAGAAEGSADTAAPD